VEFAVIALPFFILVLGMIELGRGFMVQHLLQSAARQGARIGILPSNGNTEITAAVAGVLTPAGITGDLISVQVNGVTQDAKDATTGQDVMVMVSVPSSSISWMPFNNYLNGTLSAQYTLKKQ
jgi:Flp pilus assembly protein TadG